MVSRIEEVMSLLSKLPQPIGTEAKTSRRGSKGSSDSDSEHGSPLKRPPSLRKPFSSVKELTVKLEGSANFLHWSFELRVALNMIDLAGQVLDNERDVMTQTEKGFASNLMIRSMNLSQRSLVANIDLMEPAEIYAFLRRRHRGDSEAMKNLLQKQFRSIVLTNLSKFSLYAEKSRVWGSSYNHLVLLRLIMTK